MTSRQYVFALLLITAAIAVGSPFVCLAESAITRERTVTKVDANLYVIRHADGPDGNP